MAHRYSRFDVLLIEALLALLVKPSGSTPAPVPSPANYVYPVAGTGISPVSISNNFPTEITFIIAGTVVSGDKMDFQQTSCSTAPAIDVIGGAGRRRYVGPGTATPHGDPYTRFFTLSGTGNYKLCLDKSGSTSYTAQTNIDLAVVAATSGSAVSSIHPPHLHAVQATGIRLVGFTANTGDEACFAATCVANPLSCNPGIGSGLTSLTPGTGAITTFTVGTGGVFKLCLRMNGGSDLVEQSGITLTSMVIGGTGTDPVAWFGDTARVFQLPVETLVPLLSASDMLLRGETFEHAGPWQQWFGRMVLSSLDGSRWVQIGIRKNILEFNRSRLPQGHFETLDVTFGYGPVEKPSARTEVSSIDVKIPLNFLGFDIVFWKMARGAVPKNTMIGTARRECMEVAGANIHFYVCSSPAHEFWGWQRDLSIKNAHLDLAILEFLDAHHVKGTLPELWGMQPLSEKVKKYILHEERQGSDATDGRPQGLELPELPKGVLPGGKAWAGGFSPEDLLKSCSAKNGSANNGSMRGCSGNEVEHTESSISIV